MHQELLELVANLSDGSNSDTVSPIYPSIAGSKTSSTSFSLLPAKPKIFHGRQAELEDIVISLTQQSACIAILGAGRMGKTSLAKATLHHPDVATKYETRLFIAGDSAATSIELASLIGSQCEMLRGQPSKDIDKLLQLTDNMPLAVDLIAHLVDNEGSANVLAHWEIEKTSMLSAGYGKGSNLDSSIAMSLASPHMASHPGAKDLLSLLSILPDGLSDVELVQCHLPIKDVLACRATLLRISMAYCNNKKSLKSLVPIREHIQHFYPPSQALYHPLCRYFYSLLHIFKKYEGLHQNNTKINEIRSNFGNLQQPLSLELYPKNPDIADAINCTLALNSVAGHTGNSSMTLMNHTRCAVASLRRVFL
ncbi:hypothetical protein C8R44DRAFT_747579 [Mycena epipterygia]|nr:hypothetical protein C8R44DRAFT_747579 [Mycena epipterygia]